MSSGNVVFDGQEINELSADRRARLGLTRTFQSLELFEDLTVRDNLLVAAETPDVVVVPRSTSCARRGPGRPGGAGRAGARRARAGAATPTACRATSRTASASWSASPGRSPPTPKLLLLDEPAAGLDTAESQKLGVHLRQFLDDGTSIFLIDHDMGLVLNVCDYIYVLDFGKIIAEGTPAEIRRNPAVIAAYLGETAGEAQAQRGHDAGRRARAPRPDAPSWRWPSWPSTPTPNCPSTRTPSRRPTSRRRRSPAPNRATSTRRGPPMTDTTAPSA